MEQHEKNLLRKTLCADDIDLLVCALDRTVDALEHAKSMLQTQDQESVDDPEIEIPDPSRHQKRWTPVPVAELARELELKYRKFPRQRIPGKNKTSY